MEIPKAEDADRDLFRSVLPDDPRVVIKPMFGNLGAFVNGNMFAGLLGTAIGIKVPHEPTLEFLRSIPGTAPFGPEGRAMGGYIAFPDAASGDREFLVDWVGRAFELVAALPPKAPRPPKLKKP
ncbi:MAG: TfoX/Sxy family protein [Rhodoglobus sp.]